MINILGFKIHSLKPRSLANTPKQSPALHLLVNELYCISNSGIWK